MNTASAAAADATSADFIAAATPAPHRAGAVRRKGRRWGMALAVLLLVGALCAAGAWALLHSVLPAAGMHQDFDITVNGQPWSPDALGQLLGWGIAAAVIGGLVLLALAVVLPMALGVLLLVLLLVAGLVVGAIALPVLLVLAVLLSPLLAIGALAWAVFG